MAPPVIGLVSPAGLPGSCAVSVRRSPGRRLVPDAAGAGRRRCQRHPAGTAGGDLPETAEFGRVALDFNQGVYLKAGRAVNLAAKEARLLRFLISRGGRVTSRDEILAEIWPEQPFITPRTVDVHIAWLRQKLEENQKFPKHFVTVRGMGYRFSEV